MTLNNTKTTIQQNKNIVVLRNFVAQKFQNYSVNIAKTKKKNESSKKKKKTHTHTDNNSINWRKKSERTKKLVYI